MSAFFTKVNGEPSFSNRIKSKLPGLFMPQSYRKHFSSLKNNNIILKNKDQWVGQDISEIEELHEVVSKLGIGDKLKAIKKNLIITRDKDVPLKSVMLALSDVISILEQNIIISPFKDQKIGMSDLNLIISPKYKVPMCMTQNGEMIFGIEDNMKPGMLGLPKTKEKSREIVDHLLEKLNLPRSKYLEFHSAHVDKMISTYYQIGTLYYERDKESYDNSNYAQSMFGVLRLFSEGVTEKRRVQNLKFLKSIYMNVPFNIIMPTITYHDIGKAMPEDDASSHPEVSVKILNKDKSIEESLGLDPVSWLIVKNSIQHHLVGGGISLGEYSILSMYDIFNEPELVRIISAGKVNLFIDNLTLLTACDIAGQNKDLPLNRRIEDLAESNKYLKDIFRKIVKTDKKTSECSIDEKGREYLYDKLLALSKATSETRICRYLSGQSEHIDLYTNNGYSIYQKKLEETFIKMKISKLERKTLFRFFSLLKSFPYSGLPLHSILWKSPEKTGIPGDPGSREINENGVRFLLYLSKDFFSKASNEYVKQIERDGTRNVTACFWKDYGEYGERLNCSKKQSVYLENFIRMINDGCFPRTSIYFDKKEISITVWVPKSYEKKEGHSVENGKYYIFPTNNNLV